MYALPLLEGQGIRKFMHATFEAMVGMQWAKWGWRGGSIGIADPSLMNILKVRSLSLRCENSQEGLKGPSRKFQISLCSFSTLTTVAIVGLLST